MEDSGTYKCRTTLAFSNRVDIDSAESSGQTTVTVIGELDSWQWHQMSAMMFQITRTSVVCFNNLLAKKHTNAPNSVLFVRESTETRWIPLQKAS